MAKIISKFQLIGEEPSSREEFEKLNIDFSDVKFLQINEQLLNNDFVKKWGRSLSRDARIMTKILDDLVKANTISANTGRLGIYGAFVDGPIFYSEINRFMKLNQDENFQYMKKKWPPKQHFKQSAPLKLAHFTFLFKNQGPLYCFTDPFSGLSDAIEAAEVDIHNGAVDQALVVSAFSIEDPALLYLYAQKQKVKTFCECAVALVLEKNETTTIFQYEREKNINYSYGLCGSVIT